MKLRKIQVGDVSMTSVESAIGNINLSYAENCDIHGLTSGFAIKYVNYGLEEYHIGQEKVFVQTGQFFFLRNNIPFHVSNSKRKEKTNGCCMNISLEAMPSLSNLFNNDTLFYLPFSASSSSALGKRLQELSRDSNLSEVNENYFDDIKSDIHLFSDELDTFQQRLLPHTKNKKTQQAILGALFFARDYINIHYTKNFTLDYLARKSGISKYYFLRLFNDCFGISPLNLKHALRMKATIPKIANQKESLSEIAYSLGYRDLASFSKKFKAYFGCPPSKYPF